MKWFMHKFVVNDQSWFKSLYLVMLLTYVYIFMEWIFFTTKPSFMSTMDTLQDIKIYLSTSFILMTAVLIGILLVWGLHELLNKIYSHASFTWLWGLIPTFILTSLALILIDNFTYTIFKLGIVSTSGIWRFLYALLFIGMFTGFFRSNLAFIQSTKKVSRTSVYLTTSLLVISAITFVLQIPKSALYNRLHINQSSQNLPNIILLGIDGVNAENMSVYGYARETTPNIKALAQNALIAENAFSNAANTGGALTAILTGKLPTETRVAYMPDILIGESAYQHLPGILKQAGYYTVQVTLPNYADAYATNMKDGFDVANFRKEDTFPFQTKIESLGGGSSFYFAALIFQRITERLEHIFYIRKMDNPYEMVTNPTSEITEKQRFNAMLSYLDDTDKPIFLHVHMLGTHGPTFKLRKKVFSRGEKQNQSWMPDFYDDAILDFDKYFKSLFDHLSKTGKLNNTIVILYSDHGEQWNPLNRVPLIIWFPKHEYMGRIHENAQLIDISPTILDYLQIQQPTWMHGQSLLRNDLSPTRNIFSADTSGDLVKLIDGKGWALDPALVRPPFYQLGAVNLIVCDEWFSLKLRTLEVVYGKVKGSSATTCNQASIPTPEQAAELILQRLKNDHYDISSIPANIPIEPSPIDDKN